MTSQDVFAIVRGVIAGDVGPPPQRHAVWWRAVAGVVATAALLTAFHLWSYGDCLRAFLHFDDFWLLATAAHIHLHSPLDIVQIFRPTHGFMLYRPLSIVLYFYLLKVFVGYDPASYHAAQLAFHVLNGVLVYAIAHRLLSSRLRAIACALVYAFAPGHAIAVYWNALFTITGTACYYFIALWMWLRLERPRRVPVTLLLFIVALLAGEHALSLPLVLTLAAVLLPAQVQWRRVLREQAAFYAVSGVYIAAKLYYFRYLLPITYPNPAELQFVRAAYAMTLDPVALLRNLGHYVGFAINATYALAENDSWALILGVAVLGIATLSTACVLTGRWTAQPLRAAVFGLDAFIVTLGPVLVLRGHLNSYYVGISSLGMALAVIGFASALPRGSAVLITFIVASLLAVHVTSTVYQVKRSQEFAFFDQFSTAAERWLYSMYLATAAQPTDVVVLPRDWLTTWVFDTAESHRLFMCATYAVRTTTTIDAERPAKGQVILPQAIGPVRPPASRDWMRDGCERKAASP